MCGINLLFNDDRIEIMNNCLKHRGIRSTVTSYFNGAVHLGHVRLPIQGTDKKYDHPLKVKKHSVAFVGEIFNYKELMPKANTDLPVFLDKFLKNKLDDCDGFWSAVIIDKHIHVVTDDLAKKPLYMRTNPTAISSEIKPLLKLNKVTSDKTYLGAVAKWGYCIENRTPYNEIKKIPHGSHLIFDTKGLIKMMRFPVIIRKKRNLRKELTTAVRNRLVSDIPISVLLSGGLDSTIIFELIKQYTHDFTVFHVDNDEAEYLNYLDFKGINVKTLSMDKISLKEALLWNETPIDLGSMKPQLALSKAIAAEGLNIAISGDGADELFGGYGRMKYYDSQYSDIFHELIFYHLPRLDKLMMANTIELRNPYLAKRVIECALSLSYKDRKNKHILKKIFSDIVPKPILERNKKALKIDELKEPFKYRLKLIKKFKEVFNECN